MDTSMIGLLRLAAQGLAGTGFDSPAAAVRWLTAAQAQDFKGALRSIALRAATSTAEVEDALDNGAIVRSWPMRGTLHFVTAEDLGWMLRLMTPRVIAGAKRRRAELALDDAVFAKARALAEEALSGGRAVTRAELLTALETGGIDVGPGRGYHTLLHLAQNGVVCFGPMHDGQQLIVLNDEWIRSPRELEESEALGELAYRYFRSHGPATIHDFARWSNLTMKQARNGLAQAMPNLEEVTAADTTYFMDPHTYEWLAMCRADAEALRLLPGFDEFILGYRDRAAVIPDAYMDRLVPGRNGVFQPTIVRRGHVIGTWKATGSGKNRAIAPAPFEPVDDTTAELISHAYESLP